MPRVMLRRKIFRLWQSEIKSDLNNDKFWWVKVMLTKIKKSIFDTQGAIVVEATLSLTAFMFFIVTILTIVNICYAQAKIGVAVNTTAKEISEYSYIYYLTGLNEKQKEMYENGEQARTSIDDTLESVITVFDSANSISDTASNVSLSNIGSSIGTLKEDANNIKSSVSSIQSTLETIADDPQSFALSLAALAGNEAIEQVKSKVIAGPFAKLLCQKHLVTEECSDSERKTKCNDFLKKIRVIPRGSSYLDGLDFSDSTFFLNGSTDIMVIVHYRLKLIKLLNNDITLSFTQCGTTRGWVPISKAKNADETPSESQDNDENNDEEETQPKKTREEYIEQYLDELIIRPNAADMIIGTGSADKSFANSIEAGYLIIPGDRYEQIKEDLGSDGVTQIYKAYVDKCINNSSKIRLAQNPDKITDAYTKQQIRYLKQKGYTFKYNEVSGFYTAEKS